MRVKLTRDARLTHKAGEIVEVSPETGKFLLSIESAVLIEDETEEPVSESVKPEKKPVKKVIKKK